MSSWLPLYLVLSSCSRPDVVPWNSPWISSSSYISFHSPPVPQDQRPCWESACKVLWLSHHGTFLKGWVLRDWPLLGFRPGV